VGLLLSNVAATQYVAHHFEYQPVLGAALFRFGDAKVYQPFAWISWVWRYGSSADPAVKNPLLLGAFLVVVGAFLSGWVSFLVNIRTRTALAKHSGPLWLCGLGIGRGDKGNRIARCQARRLCRRLVRRETQHLHYLRHNGPEHVLASHPREWVKE